MATFDEGLHPRGQAGNAGQFRQKVNSAPAGSLAEATGEPDQLIITVPTEWVERDVIPPRARKPRDIRHVTDLTVAVTATTSEDAPTGFTVPTHEWVRIDGKAEFVESRIPVRAFEGRLFTPVRNHDGAPIAATPASALEAIFQPNFDGVVRVGSPESIEGAQQDADTEANRFLAVDGELWRETGEPVFRVRTYGFGANNGSTSLSTDFLTPSDDTDRVLDEFTFPANQLDQAVAAAMRIATERGDSDSLNGIESTTPIETTGVFPVASTYRQAPRLDYRSPSSLAYDAARDGDDQIIRREFDRFKAQLMGVPGAVVEVDDGWGGTTKTINRRVLTERQSSDYDHFIRLTSSVNQRI